MQKRSNLVMTVNAGNTVQIGGCVTITVVTGNPKIAFNAPENVPIVRGNVSDKRQLRTNRQRPVRVKEYTVSRDAPPGKDQNLPTDTT